MKKCRVCGAAHVACGPSTVDTVTPLTVTIRREEPAMALEQYEVAVGNRRGTMTTTMKLTAEDAKRLGGTPVVAKQAKPPANKARVAATKAKKATTDKATASAADDTND